MWIVALIGLLVVGVSTVALLSHTRKNSPKRTRTVQRSDLIVTVKEQGTLESSNATEIRCKVRGRSVITWDRNQKYRSTLTVLSPGRHRRGGLRSRPDRRQ